jgi:hypothetical protein
MESMNNLADYTKIAVIAFIGILVINRILDKTGFPEFKA